MAKCDSPLDLVYIDIIKNLFVGRNFMDQPHYAKLTEKEISKLPFYIKKFYLGKNLSQTTKYQYLT